MAATPITINFGETVHRDFFITGIDFEPEHDALLFVIRDKTEKVLLWKVLEPEYKEDLHGWVVPLDIAHAESESQLPMGSYKYGLTYYHNYTGDEYPTDGDVVVTIARKAFNVKEAVAREEGLS